MMSRFYRTDDPGRDFDRMDAEYARYHARLSKCEKCKATIEDEDYYEIEGEILCEDCMKEKYRKKTHDYAEGYE